MYKGKRILAVIPARGGSKGIPRKNIRILNDKPLIAYSIEVARQCEYIDKTIVSTDDQEIATIALEYGAEVPFIRPSYLAQDNSKTIDVLLHAVSFYKEQQVSFDYLMLLQPTQPIREVYHLQEVIKYAIDEKRDSVVSVCKVEEHPLLMRKIGADGALIPILDLSSTMRRQDFPDVYKVNGSIYFNKLDENFSQETSLNDNIYPYLMEREYSVDIDSIADFAAAQKVLDSLQREQFIIYGTGTIAEEIYHNLVSKHGKESVKYFIDSMLKKKEFCGKQVISPDMLEEIRPNRYKFYLGSLTSKLSMKNELLKHGVNSQNIIVERDYGTDSFEQNVTSVEQILFVPAITSKEEFVNLEEKVLDLVPNMKKHSIKPTIIVEKGLIGYLESSIFQMTDKIEQLTSYDLVLVTKQEELQNPQISVLKNVYCIDPNYFRMIDIRILLRVNLVLTKEESKRNYQKQIISNYETMKKEMNGDSAYIFGAGPSCMSIVSGDIPQECMRMVCNFFINNKELMDTVKPNVYILANEIVLLKDYENLLEKIVEYIKKQMCYLVVPEVVGKVIFERYSEVRNWIISFDFNTDQINFPSIEKMSVYRKAYNVITAFAIPLASALYNSVYIAGCDGKALDKDNCKTTWSYAEKCKSEKPYRNEQCKTEENWLREYFTKHYSYFNELLQYGESIGKKYISITDSFIPCLHERLETK